MAKKSRFLDAVAPEAPAKPARAPRPRVSRQTPDTKTKQPSREGKRIISMHVSPECHKQLKQICLDEDLLVQDAMFEALNLFFQSRGKTRLAG